MPSVQSQLFLELTENKQLNSDRFNRKLLDRKVSYQEINDLLREVNDAQFGIISTFNQEKNTWLRDATQAIPLEERISHESPLITANNTLLRCLSRLRPIEYAISKKLGEKEPHSTNIRQHFSQLSLTVLQLIQTKETSNKEKNQALKKAEEAFNTYLIEELHHANLTKGCDSQKKAEKLLFYYRNLSSLLIPTRTMVTLTYDEKAQVLQRETQYPVTKKTDLQKKIYEKKPHNQQSAFQEADALFADLIVSDDTTLPAQARKTHIMGAKNAFLVKNELFPIAKKDFSLLENEQATEENTLWLARAGSPVYIGNGETQEAIQLHTQEILNQIRNKIIELGLDKTAIQVITLNTNTPLEQQNRIIKHIKAATRNNDKNKDNYSYIPTNTEGTFRILDIAPELNFKNLKKPQGIAPLQKASRLKSASIIIVAAAQTEHTCCLIHCASGQDRTGTALEKAVQSWMKKRYISLGKDPCKIQIVRAEGGNSAEITSHLVVGSPGKKKASIANNFFGKKKTFKDNVTNEYYRKSANTNKQNKVNKVSFLDTSNQLTIEEFYTNYGNFAKALENYKHSNEKTIELVQQKGTDILNTIDTITHRSPQKLTLSMLIELSEVISCANQILLDPKNPTYKKNLANHISPTLGKQSYAWKTLGISLMLFGGAMLVAVGVLACIPSIGAGLLVALGIGGALGIGIGALSFFHSREKGVAKSLRKFETILSEVDNIKPSNKL